MLVLLVNHAATIRVRHTMTSSFQTFLSFIEFLRPYAIQSMSSASFPTKVLLIYIFIAALTAF